MGRSGDELVEAKEVVFDREGTEQIQQLVIRAISGLWIEQPPAVAGGNSRTPANRRRNRASGGHHCDAGWSGGAVATVRWDPSHRRAVKWRLRAPLAW